MVQNKKIKFIFIFLVLTIIGIVLVCKSFKKSTILQEKSYTKQINKNVNYTVQLNKNNYYDEKTISESSLYISNLVKNINIKFNIEGSIENCSEIYYNYNIVNTVYIQYANNTNSNDNTLWSKQYELKNTDTTQLEDLTKFNISDGITIDYQKYRKQAQNFKSEYQLPTEAYMEIKILLNYDYKIEGMEQKQQQSTIVLKIPLLQEVFSIEEIYQPLENEIINKDNGTITDETSVDKIKLIFGILIIAVSIIVILRYIKNSINTNNDDSTELNKILRNYEDIIVEVINPVETDYMKIINVKKFENLVDIEEEIRMPILFYETVPNQEGEFIILSESVAYRYAVSKRKNARHEK